MYWEVGISIDGVSGVYNVHPQPLEQPLWNHAVEHAMDMAQALYPDSHIEMEFVSSCNTIQCMYTLTPSVGMDDVTIIGILASGCCLLVYLFIDAWKEK